MVIITSIGRLIDSVDALLLIKLSEVSRRQVGQL